MSLPATHREVRLAALPDGELTPGHFEVVTAPVPAPGPGQVLVRNRLMSVAAVMRPLTLADPDAFGLPQLLHKAGEVMRGAALGEVVRAPGTDLAPGTIVRHRAGWREYAVLNAPEVSPVDPEVLPDPAAHLSQGFTAWLGVVRGAGVRRGDTVFVTGAAGGVGSLAGQFARLHGAARVIGSTGSRYKADRLTRELGYDAVVLRGAGSAGSIEEQLCAAAPDGIDVLFDTVGGEQLRAALALARRNARFALVGALAAQLSDDALAPTAISTLDLITRSVTLRGISAVDHQDAMPGYLSEFGRALREGALTYPYTRLTGLDRAPGALCELVAGRHLGAVLVEL
ncbi:MDR family NADP-dependent oxidoreductase [Streptomyces rhizosphaericus]|uniref:NADP-dependent oxidoreductase n=1 Tax=Streptomyces rhizosphaericus TaxID=114699 RepID=A0A6G4AR75_9ACTN|nr:NADP-dependent oxidoreductase [Streptomyces rhizosphaericus]NEW75855.1 NADP-dependent oxidoreductase [Streptomyces rhizosphaericus]